ncbi:uncharacterized protein DS421_12g371530 [Arachis hypogaea]|nr:uncharacterized protein DS421_12g371530 [Arachis hypogaea]
MKSMVNHMYMQSGSSNALMPFHLHSWPAMIACESRESTIHHHLDVPRSLSH